VLESHSTKSVITIQREFRRKIEKDPPTANSIRKCYKNLWTQVASVRERVQDDRVRVRKQLIVLDRLISEVQGSQLVG